MLFSYSRACSQSIYELSCFVCLNGLESSNSPDICNPGWNVVGLPQCKHLIHQSCYKHWALHSRELACRDVRVEKRVTCPLCRVIVDEDKAFLNVDCDFFLLEYDNPDPDPELPLTPSETPDPDSHCDIQSLQVLFDKAVSVDYSTYYFNVSNFPALHQMKNRYGITLSAEQLDKILNEALLPSHANTTSEIVGASASNKIKMAMLLRSDDVASKEVIKNVFKKILNLGGNCQEFILYFLLDQGMSDEEELLQKFIEHHIQNENYEQAGKINHKYGLRIRRDMLKQILMQVKMKSNVTFLAKIAGSSDNFHQAKLEALRTLNETHFDRGSFPHIKDTIDVLLSTGTKDQPEVNNSLRLAVLADDRSWQGKLQKNYGAVLEAQFFKEQLEGVNDSDLINKILSLYKLRADDEVSTAALNAALMRVLTANHDHCRYSRVEHLLTKCLDAGILNQELSSRALTQAIDADRYAWVKELNMKCQAVLDPQDLKNCLWKKLSRCPQSMYSRAEEEFVYCVKSILSVANKDDEQSGRAVSFVLERLLGDVNLSQNPVIQKCIMLLEGFNDVSTNSPKPKRKKIALL